MYIKKHSTHNEYIRAGGVWVRNFTKPGVPALLLDHLFQEGDYPQIISNESRNRKYPQIAREKISMQKVVIVSDGYNFAWKHLFVGKFPKDVSVLAINGALRNWKLMTSEVVAEERKAINAYVANNPYAECLQYLPGKHKYFPACVASVRTNHEFMSKYAGDKYVYEPPPDNRFGVERKESYCVDDYRNPVCAAIGLAFHFGVEKLMLISCDDAFAKERDFAVPLPNGLWTYPQQIRSHEIIDANLYWLTHQEDVEVQVTDWSDGPKYTNATYINSEEEAMEFFAEGGQQ